MTTYGFYILLVVIVFFVFILLVSFQDCICYLIGHKFKIVGRSGGNDWGWNDLKCERCGYKSDSLTE